MSTKLGTWATLRPGLLNQKSELLTAIDKDGCISVPDEPGLGVNYDWKSIESHKTGYVDIR